MNLRLAAVQFKHFCSILFVVAASLSTEALAQCSGYATAPYNMSGTSLGTYYYIVTGSSSGSGWGTGTYTDDSALAKMAVHAGIVSVGGQAIIRVNRIAGVSSYTGSTQNGVSTSSYGSWSGSYTLALHQSCGSGTDSVPDQFSFTNATGVNKNSRVTSNAITVTGFNVPLSVSVSGQGDPWIRVNGGQWVTSATIQPGNQLQANMYTAGTPATTLTMTVTIGGVSATFSNTTATETGDHTPDPYSFTNQTGVAPGSLVLSNTTTITGFTVPQTVSVDGDGGPQIRVNGGAWNTSATIAPGDSLQVSMYASASPNTINTAHVHINGVHASWSVTSGVTPDPVPNQFSFSNVSGASPGTVVNSNVIVLSGFNVSQTATVTGDGAPQIKVNSESWTSSATVSAGDQLQVRATSPSNYSTTSTVTVGINGVTANWSVSTMAPPPDNVPDPFSFTNATNVSRNSRVSSNPVTLTGFNMPLTVSATGDGAPLIKVNGGQGYASATVNPGDSFQVNMYTSGYYSTTLTATVNINGVSASFSNTTLPENGDATPDQFSFTNQTDVATQELVTSNTITVTGFNMPQTVTVDGDGGPNIKVNNGAWNTSATISPGDQLQVRMYAASTPNTTRTANVHIYNVHATWSTTTAPPPTDNVPDQFSFTNATNVARNSRVDSNPVTLTGFNVPLTVSATGDGAPLIKVNGGQGYASATVSPGDSFQVNMYTSGYYATTLTATVNINGVSASFSNTTAAEVGDSTPDQFSFSNTTGVRVGALSVSEPVTVTGFDNPQTVTVDGEGGPNIRVNNGQWNTNAIIAPGDQLQVRLSASPDSGVTRTANIHINNVHATWSATTLAATVPAIWSLSAEQGTDSSQSGAMTIMQDLDVRFEWDASNVGLCKIEDLELPMETTAVGSIASLTLQAFYFDAGTHVIELSCTTETNITTSKTFQLTVVENPQNPKPAAPAISQVQGWRVAAPTNVVNFTESDTEELTFRRDEGLGYSYSVSNADLCYLNDGLRNYETTPQPSAGISTNVGSWPPYRFPEGAYDYLFYCVGKGGMSAPVKVRLNAAQPLGELPLPPADPAQITDEYTLLFDSSSRKIKVTPLGGVSTFPAFVIKPLWNGGEVYPVDSSGTWSSANLDYEMGDFNADGLDDMLIKNIPMQVDHIVYANEFGQMPVDSVQVTEQFKQFFHELNGIMMNPNYIAENTGALIIRETFVGYYPTFYCDCFLDWVQRHITWTFVYTGKVLPDNSLGMFHPEITPDFAQKATRIFSSGGLTSASDWQELARVLGRVLNTDFMGGVLDLPGLVLTEEAPIPTDVLAQYRAGRIISLLGHPNSPWVNHLDEGAILMDVGVAILCTAGVADPFPVEEALCAAYLRYRMMRRTEAAINVLGTTAIIVLAELDKDRELSEEEKEELVEIEATIYEDYERTTCRRVWRGVGMQEMDFPFVVFTRGMRPKGTDWDLEHHVLDSDSSLYVSTSKSKAIASTFPIGVPDGYTYQIVTDRGVDVNLSIDNPMFFNEQEVAIPFLVSPTEVEGVYVRENFVSLPAWTPNPQYVQPCPNPM